MTAAVPMIIEGTYTVVGSTAAATGVRAAFGAVVRNAGKILTWGANAIGFGTLASSISRGTGVSTGPTPLPGGGGGGIVIPPGGSTASGSTGGLPVPVPRSSLPATVKGTAVSSPKVTTVATSTGQKAGTAIIINNGKTKVPNIIPAQSDTISAVPSLLQKVQLPAAATGAALTVKSIIDEAQGNPLRTIGIVLGVGAAAIALYSVAKR